MSVAVLAIDYGEKRVGVARASVIARLPEPLVTLENNSKLLSEIKKLAEEQNATTLVVGLPRSLEGVDTEQTMKVRDFIDQLHQEGFSVVAQDEAVTSEYAKSELLSTKKAFGKSDIDQLAAVYILQDYLNELGDENG